MTAVVGPAAVPTLRAVRDVLTTLFTRDVDVAASEPWSGDDGATTYAVYVDDLLRARVVAVADVGFSARAGAAIGLLPPVFADRATDRGTLPAMLTENLDEVLNVCVATLNGPGCPHLRLYRVHHVGEDVPTDLLSYAAVPGRRLDLEVSIPTYGSGLLSFVAVD